MRKKILSIIAVAALAAAALAAAVALQVGVSDAAARGPGPGGPGGGQGTTTTHPVSDPSRPLTAADAAGLTFMREEEKLARDVYTVLGDTYDVRAFDNIARSESKHMAAVKRLMDIYSIPDPVGSDVPGVFKDPAFTQLYAALTAQGRQSLAGALQAGVTIEKMDIADLEARIAATDRADLKAVYGNLLRASQNHLRAFNRLLGSL
jgi:hypothetical protein